MSKFILLTFFIIVFCIFPALSKASDTPQFIFPTACTYGQDCWAVNYVDVDPSGSAIKDFKCNAKSYEDHNGTDFALGSIARMNTGVDVLAAAAGKVLRMRDGESDDFKTSQDLEKIRKETKECGNGVILDHGNGLETIYCHMKKGSIIVKPHEKLRAGQKIGQIGQSGLAEFPHLHFGVTWEGGNIDPYTGMLDTDGCGKMKKSLWALGLPMTYEPISIFDGGFQDAPPDFLAIQKGEETPKKDISKSSTALVFWSGFYNVEEGDNITLQILDPDGEEFNMRHETTSKTRSRQYYFTGRKIANVHLKLGRYKGIATLTRIPKDGSKPITRTKTFEVNLTP